jgi:hypothetical protein
MKKILLCLFIFALIGGASLFAWEPNDLTRYPKCLEQDPWQLNFGFGLGNFPEYSGGGYYWFPPIRLTFDRSTPLGDKQLPFFFGGLVGFSAHGYNGNDHKRYFWGCIPLGVRVGYHFNWGVDNLDTYAVSTFGWRVYFGDMVYKYGINDMMIDVNVGARWFLNDWFGFWAEGGYSPFSFLSIGLAFKF